MTDRVGGGETPNLDGTDQTEEAGESSETGETEEIGEAGETGEGGKSGEPRETDGEGEGALSDETEHRVVRVLQVGLVGLLVFGLIRWSFGIVVNAAIALAVTFVPAALEREYRLSMDPGLVLWLTVAVFLHAVGILGLYKQFPWYDIVTHTLSGAVVAGAGYAAARALDVHAEDVDIPSPLMGMVILVFVLAFGVVWEIVEFAAVLAARVTGSNPVLVIYGVDDVALDLVFDAVGGVIVAVWGASDLRGFSEAVAARLGS